MMTPARMDEMGNLRGAGFDQVFLQSMIEHHNGAITMARYALDNGRFPALATLASEVIATQQAEIVAMQALLTRN
jgi:uncharacterized protein (DUF305 family)